MTGQIVMDDVTQNDQTQLQKIQLQPMNLSFPLSEIHEPPAYRKIGRGLCDLSPGSVTLEADVM